MIYIMIIFPLKEPNKIQKKYKITGTNYCFKFLMRDQVFGRYCLYDEAKERIVLYCDLSKEEILLFSEYGIEIFKKEY